MIMEPPSVPWKTKQGKKLIKSLKMKLILVFYLLHDNQFYFFEEETQKVNHF